MAGFDLIARLTLQDDFTKKMSRAERQMSNMEKATRRMGGGMRSFASQVASIGTAIGITAAISKGINVISNSLDGAIDRYDTIQNFAPMMEGLGISADIANKSITRLTEGIQGLPTALPEAVSATKQIASMTGDLEKATESYLALNNALIASGARPEQVGNAMDQMIKSMASGKMEMDNWTTLMESMPMALNKVAEAFGYTGNRAKMDLYDALKEGDITMDQLIDKFIELNEAQGGFAELAQTASGGLRVAWGNMMNAITAGLTGTIEAFDKALGGAGTMEDGIKRIQSGIANAFKFVNSQIEPAVQKFRDLYDALKPHMPLIKGLAIGIGLAATAIVGLATGATIITGLGTALAFMANPVGLVVAGIAALVIAFTAAYNSSETFRNAVSAFIDGVKAKFAEMSPGIEAIKAAFVSFGETAMSAFGTMWGVAQPILSLLWTALKALGEVVVMVVSNVIAPLITYLAEVFRIMWSVVGPILDLLGVVLKAVGVIVKGVWENAFKPLVAWLLSKFKQAIEISTKALQPIGDAFETLGSKISGVVDWLKSVAEWFRNIKVPDWVSSLGGKVTGFVGKTVANFTGAASHYHGIDAVPYDGYRAVLHKGERVQTAQEVKAQESGKFGGGITINMGGVTIREEADIDRLADAMVRKIQAAGGAGA